MNEIVEVFTSLFECVKKENNDINSDIKDLRDETYVWIYNFRLDISTLENRVDGPKPVW